jgi:hypothetical protein
MAAAAIAPGGRCSGIALILIGPCRQQNNYNPTQQPTTMKREE